ARSSSKASGGTTRPAKTASRKEPEPEAAPVQQAIDEPELAPEPEPEPEPEPAAVGAGAASGAAAASDAPAELENEGPWLLDMVTDDAGDKAPGATK
ncbi:MAG: hypothetical protein M3271_06170, partial [Actinomycetota bacterium]|nr:hypothetical protein [Actinomycetota bacterium]